MQPSLPKTGWLHVTLCHEVDQAEKKFLHLVEVVFHGVVEVRCRRLPSLHTTCITDQAQECMDGNLEIDPEFCGPACSSFVPCCAMNASKIVKNWYF